VADGNKPKGKPRGRSGGRPKGALAQETIIKGQSAERVLAAATSGGKKLATDVLEDFMNLFAGMAAFYQPMPDGTIPPNRRPDENKFEKYARLTIKVAGELAPYQSATFRAILAAAPAPKTQPGELKRVFTLQVFDNARPQQVSDDAKLIEGKPTRRKTK